MPNVSITKVFQRLASGHVDPIYLFFGDETYSIHQYTASCIDQILGAAPRDFNYDSFTVSGDNLLEALSLAKTLPIMSNYRVLVLHDIHKLRKSEVREIESYAASPSETTALICTATGNTWQKSFPQARRQAMVVECKRLEGTQLRKWVTTFIEQQGYTITAEAIHGFLHEQQNDLWTLKREIEKLCTFCGERKEIGVTEVQEICQPIHVHSIFSLTDAIGAQQIGKAFSLIDNLIQQGEPPLVIFSLIVRHVRLLWSAKGLSQQGKNIGQMAKTLRLPPQVCRQLTSQCKSFSLQHLQRLYKTIVEADLAFKTTTKPPKFVLEDLILALCSEP
jgi:DNA polymerase-3 subunit delta